MHSKHNTTQRNAILPVVRSDLAPEASRAEFLGIFTLVTDIGATSGPLIVGFVSQATNLATCAAVVALIGLFGALWMGLCMAETAPRAKQRLAPLHKVRPTQSGGVAHTEDERHMGSAEQSESRAIELAEAAEGRAPIW
jgi:MFS family permease